MAERRRTVRCRTRCSRGGRPQVQHRTPGNRSVRGAQSDPAVCGPAPSPHTRVAGLLRTHTNQSVSHHDLDLELGAAIAHHDLVARTIVSARPADLAELRLTGNGYVGIITQSDRQTSRFGADPATP